MKGDITMEFIQLDPNNTNIETLLDTISKNSAIAKSMTKEIEKLQKANDEYQNITKKQKEMKENKSSNKEKEKNTPSKTKEDFENEIEYFFNMLDSITDSTMMKEEIKSILPSKKKSNYHPLVLRLKMELLKNIKDIQDLIEEEKDGLTKEDLEEFKEEIRLNQAKLSIMNDIEKETENENEVVENHLFLVPTSGGNIRVLEEIEDMDIEYLPLFKGLFDSIKEGTFKNVKQFISNNKMAKFAEVKDFKVRIVFDRIGRNDYAIITAFVKKSDNDRGYQTSLQLKMKNYLMQKEQLKLLLQNEEFRKENALLEEELYHKLGNKENHKVMKKEV